MPKGELTISSAGDEIIAEEVPHDLLRKIQRVEDPEELLELCVLGGQRLIQMRPNLPRRILNLAAKSEDQKKADRVRFELASTFPEILRMSDLSWLGRLGLREPAVQMIKQVLADGEASGHRLCSAIMHLVDFGEFDTVSAAFDSFAFLGVDDPQFCKTHYGALIGDRRFADAIALQRQIRRDFGDAKYREIFTSQWSQLSNKPGFKVLTHGPSKDEGLDPFEGSVDEGLADQPEDWQRRQSDIIYRLGRSDTALIIYPGPQTPENAETWIEIIDICDKLGVGQVCLPSRKHQHLTGVGRWEGRPEVTINFLVDALKKVGIRNFATAGVSGTSLAATIAGAEIDAAGVLLMPAVTHIPDPDQEPNPRAARAAARMFRDLPKGVYDARPYLNGKSVPIWAHLPQRSEFDCRQIEHLSAYPNLHVVAHDYDGHAIMPWLAKHKVLESSVYDFLSSLGWISH